jgi:ribosome-binding protein aMBF1 (putative translation factor)
MSLTYLGKKKYHRCDCCGDMRSGDVFEWHLMLSKSVYEICLKCAKRDYGKVYVETQKKRKDDV